MGRTLVPGLPPLERGGGGLEALLEHEDVAEGCVVRLAWRHRGIESSFLSISLQSREFLSYSWSWSLNVSSSSSSSWTVRGERKGNGTRRKEEAERG